MALMSRKLLGAVGAAVMVVAACSGTASTTAPSAGAPSAAVTGCNVTVNADGSLAPLEDGFPSKAFTIINIDDPGAPDGIYALALKTAIESSGITDQRVTVVDRPDFGTYGTWEGLEFENSTPEGKDGYVMAVATIPGSVVDLLMTDVTAALGATIEKLGIIASTEYVPYAMTSRKDAPWGTDVGEMIKYAQAHPGELKYISRGPGSGLDLAFESYRQIAGKVAGIADGIPVTTVIGGSHAEINAVLGSGEGDIAMTLSDVAKQFYEDGHVEVLSFSGNAPAPAPFKVQTMHEYFGSELSPSDPWGQNRTLFISTDVPDCHQEWLVKMVELAVSNDAFKTQRLNVPGLTLQWLDEQGMWDLGKVAYEAACPIVRDAGLLDPGVAATNPC